jgi:hypothetical protein
MKRPSASDRGPVVIGHINDLIALTPAERLRRLARLPQYDCRWLLHEWRFWARADQVPPPGDWVTWLILAGRGAGKTRTGAEAVRRWIKDYSPVNLIGATAADARDVMVLGESGLLACCPRAERPTYARSTRRLSWPNGNVSLLFSAEEPDRLRGEQHFSLDFRASPHASPIPTRQRASARPIRFSPSSRQGCRLISGRSMSPLPFPTILGLRQAPCSKLLISESPDERTTSAETRD